MTGLSVPGHGGAEIGHNQTKVGNWMQELTPLEGLEKLNQIRPESSPEFVKSVLLELKGFLERRITNVNLDIAGEFHNALKFLGYIKVFNTLSFLEELALTPIDISKTKLIAQVDAIRASVDDIVYGDDFKVGGSGGDDE